MNDIIDKYIISSKENLNIILINLENNIEFTNNNIWKNNTEFKDIIKSITNIYFEKYFLYCKNDFSKIDKFIKFNNKINRKLKTILLSIIDYYENNNILYKITNEEDTILYLTVLYYLSLKLYEENFNNVDNPKKIEKYINNIIDNFKDIKFKKEKDLVILIQNIKDILLKNSEFNNNINKLSTNDSHNTFIKINDNDNYYKVLYEYEIDKLNNYNELDINIVNNKINIFNILNGISYDLVYFTVFKLLKNGMNKKILFKITKEEILDDKILDYMIKRNSVVVNNIKFLVDYNDIKDNFDMVNKICDKNINIFVEVNDGIETNNYNMFMNLKNIIVPEEFLSKNEKYIEIWKDMNMNFIVKDLQNKINEKELLGRK